MSINGKQASWLDHQLEHAGLKGKELAARMGVSEATISRLRNGRTGLSAKTKARLSRALFPNHFDTLCAKSLNTPQSPNLKKCDITLSPSPALPHLPHNLISLKQACFNHGIRLNRSGILCEALKAPGDYIDLIEKQIAKGEVILSVGYASDFERCDLHPFVSFSPQVPGRYHLTTRLLTPVPNVIQTPPHKRLCTLKLLAEHFAHADIWQNNLERFSWRSNNELAFLKTLRGITTELVGLTATNTINVTDCWHKAGLDSLHAVGKDSADFVLQDDSLLGSTFSFKNVAKTGFQVVLDLHTLVGVIEGLSSDAPRTLLIALQNAYGATDVSSVIERFKSKWLQALYGLAEPYYWQMFASEQLGEQYNYTLADQLHSVMTDLRDKSNEAAITFSTHGGQTKGKNAPSMSVCNSSPNSTPPLKTIRCEPRKR